MTSTTIELLLNAVTDAMVRFAAGVLFGGGGVVGAIDTIMANVSGAYVLSQFRSFGFSLARGRGVTLRAVNAGRRTTGWWPFTALKWLRRCAGALPHISGSRQDRPEPSRN